MRASRLPARDKVDANFQVPSAVIFYPARPVPRPEDHGRKGRRKHAASGGLVSSLLPGPPGALPALEAPFRAASGEPAGVALPGHEERFRISRFMAAHCCREGRGEA